MALETGQSTLLNMDGSMVNLMESTQGGPKIGRKHGKEDKTKEP